MATGRPSRSRSKARQALALKMRELRRKRKLSQESLAARAGLHRTYVGAIERGERNVSIDNIERIAKALGCSICTLLGCDGK